MRYLVLICLALIGFIAVPSGEAAAACTDAATPEVQWVRCLMNERQLTGVDLRNAVLRGSSFSRGDLSGANLSGVDARRTKFVSANLQNARLDGASLRDADLTKADLSGASLRNTDLREARLFRANLKGANLTGARLDGADLWNADLSGATWVDGSTVCGENSIGQCR